MANDIDLDKLVLEAAYQPASPPFNNESLDKVVLQAAYKPLSPVFDAMSIDKAALTVVYQRLTYSPGDADFPNVVLLLGTPGADASTLFTDDSITGRTLTTVANAQVDTAQSKFGGSSALFDGTGDWITAPDSTDWFLSTGSFTFEAFVRFNALPGAVSAYIVSQWDPATVASQAFAWGYGPTGGGNYRFVFNSGSTTYTLQTPWAPSTGVWYHLVVERDSVGVFRFCIDGVQVYSQWQGQSINNSPNPLRIGGLQHATTSEFNGWLDELRITKGLARYVRDYSTNADANWANVLLLIGADGTDAVASFGDESSYGRALTVVGNAQIDTAQFKWGNASMLLDGSGDRVTAADSADWQMTGAWTVEAWVRFRITETGANYLFSQWSLAGGDRSWGIQYFNNGWHLAYTTDGTTTTTISNSWTQTGATWFHFAATRDGSGDVRMFIDGTQIGTTQAGSGTYFNSTQPFVIGAILSSTPANDWDGWIDDFRVTKGVARYTSNFTAPTAAFPRPVIAFTPPTAAYPRGLPSTAVSDTASVTGVSATGSVGQVTVTTSSGTSVTAGVTGVQAAGSVGQVEITTTGSAIVAVTGVSATASVGQVSVALGRVAQVTGLQATASVGQVSVIARIGAIAQVTGLQASAQIGAVAVAAIVSNLQPLPPARMAWPSAEDRSADADKEERSVDVAAQSRIISSSAEDRIVKR